MVSGGCKNVPYGGRKVLDGVSYVTDVVKKGARKVSGRDQIVLGLCQEVVRWCQDGVRKVSD